MTQTIDGGWRKRPQGATLRQLADYRARGLSYGEIAKIWGVSRARVYDLYRSHRVEVDALISAAQIAAAMPPASCAPAH